MSTLISPPYIPLTQQAWGPLSSVAYKDTQPLQRCVYPHTPLTQGTVPCTASQSAQKTVTSALYNLTNHMDFSREVDRNISKVHYSSIVKNHRHPNKMLHLCRIKEPKYLSQVLFPHRSCNTGYFPRVMCTCRSDKSRDLNLMPYPQEAKTTRDISGVTYNPRVICIP